MSLSSGSDERRYNVVDKSLAATNRATMSMSSQRKRPLLRSKAKTHSESGTAKTKSTTTSRLIKKLKFLILLIQAHVAYFDQQFGAGQLICWLKS